MIDKMNFDPQEAITAFNEARGHEMERENYLIDLLNSNKAPEERVPVDNASDGEIIEDEDDDDDDDDDDGDDDSDETLSPIKPDVADPPVVPPGVAEKTELFPSVENEKSAQRANVQGNFQGDFRWRGFPRWPQGNRGFQNSSNYGGGGGTNNNSRGGGGGFHQNIDNRRGASRSRNRGGGGAFRGNLRGGRWKERGYQKPSYYDYDDGDLDEDTEVIITATERGTIIREERSISEHRRKLAEAPAHGRGGGGGGSGQQFRNASFKRGRDDDDDGGGGGGGYRTARDRPSQFRFEESWGVDAPPQRKRWMAGDEAFSERDSWKAHGPFEGGAGFEGMSHGRGRGSADGSLGGRGFGAGQRSRRSWSPETMDSYHGGKESRFRRQDQNEDFRARGGEGYKGLVEGRGGYSGHGRERERESPLRRDVSPLGFGSRARAASYDKDGPGVSFAGEEPPGKFKDVSRFSRFGDGNAPGFFDKKSRLSFDDDGGGGGGGPGPFGKKAHGGAYRDDSPPEFGEKLRKPKYRARGGPGRGSFAGGPFREAEGGEAALATRRRRMTPPAQYRDPEPDDGEESPPFCDDSPPFAACDYGFGARSQAGEESFRPRGRGFSRGAY